MPVIALVDLRAQTFQHRRHFQAWSDVVELRKRQLIVCFRGVGTILASPLNFGDFLFHCENGIGASSGIILPCNGQHLRQIVFIGRADPFELRIVEQVHVPVGKTGAALENLEDINVGIFVVLADKAAKQRPHPVTRSDGQQLFECRFALYRAHPRQPGLDRLQPQLFNPCLIEIARIGIPRLAALFCPFRF
jgi:hypothetical protein